MKSPSELLCDRIVTLQGLDLFHKRNLNIAISGGTSPDTLFALWADTYFKIIDWRRINIFWVDERCVPPGHPESNYGRAYQKFLKESPLPDKNIFRIEGEINPSEAALAYEKIVKSVLGETEGFDLAILGIGDDGHTSSVFPGQTDLYFTEELYKNSVNPYSGQNRIALTLPGILKSKEIVFYLNGPSKQDILKKMDENRSENLLPAEFVIKNAGKSFIYWDNAPGFAFVKLNSIFVK
ncbi:6-phosphogluconolactonase [Bacteroidales bacterium]